MKQYTCQGSKKQAHPKDVWRAAYVAQDAVTENDLKDKSLAWSCDATSGLAVPRAAAPSAYRAYVVPDK